jgi:hypothetical protein
MPKVKCRCGYIFNLSIDSPFDYKLIPENDILELIVEANKGPVNGDRIHELLSKNDKQVLICPQCQKLLVDESEGIYTAYEKLLPSIPSGENVYGNFDPSP